MNTANQNAQGTRPPVVGQMSELVEEYKQEYPNGNFEDWKKFYYHEYHGEERIGTATERVFEMIVKMREAAEEIDREMVHRWVEDLYSTKRIPDLERIKKLSSRSYLRGTK